MNFTNFLIVFCDKIIAHKNLSDERLTELHHDSYIKYKNFCNELHYMNPNEWFEFFFQDFDLETHDFMLKSKLKGLYDLAKKSKIK